MKTPILIEVAPEQEKLVRRVLALSEEMTQLALSAPDGRVVDDCETLIVEQGRKLQSQMLNDAVARKIESAEKRGRPSADARVADKKKTRAPKNGTC